MRTVIITGGNSGLGYACARALLEDASGAPPSHIVIACRDPRRAETAVAGLRDEVSGIGSPGQVEAMGLNLASLQSVRDFVRKVGDRLDLGNLPPLYALVCNAGVQSGGKQTFTADGFESTFGGQPPRPLPLGQPSAAPVGSPGPSCRGGQRHA